MTVPQGFTLVEDVPEGFSEIKDDDSSVLAGLETALSLGSSSLAAIPAGLAGLLTAPYKGADAAAETVKKIQDKLTFEPRTKKGKEYTEKTGEILNKPVEWLGAAGEYVGGNEGRLAGEIAGNFALDLIPFGAGVAGVKKALSKKKSAPAPIVRDIGPSLEAARPLPSDIGLTVDKLPQAVRDQQAIYNRTPEPVVEPQRIPDTQTAELPFDATPDEMVRERYMQDFTNPDDVPMQRDMFAEEQLRQGDMDPYADGVAKEQQLSQVDAEAQALKRQQIEDLYSEREQAAQRATAEERALVQDDMFTRLEEELRSEAYQPPKVKGMRQGGGRPGMGGQGGAINVADIMNAADFLKKGFISSRDYFASWKGAFHPDELKKAMEAITDPTSKDKIVLMSPEQFHQLALPRAEPWNAVEKAGRDEKHFSVRVALQGSKGLRDIPYLRLENKNGKTVIDAHEGRHRMDVFKEQGIPLVPVRMHVGEGVENLTQALPEKSRYNLPVEPVPLPEPIGRQGMAPPIPGQGGGALIDLLTFGQANRIAKLFSDSPEVVAARRANERARKAKLILGTDESFRVDMDTPEKVVAAALDGARDITWGQKARGKTVTGGANRVAMPTNNPLVKWMRDSVRTSLRDAENVMRTWVTNKDGLGGMWKAMSQAERNDVWGALRQADQKQVDLTRDMLVDHGFNERQIAAIEHIQKMQDALFERTNAAYLHAGLEPIKRRAGHLPGVFKGDYRSLVMSRSGVDKNGKPIWKPVQYFGNDTAVGHRLTRAKVEEMFQGPGFRIDDIPRRTMKQTPGFSGDVGVLMDLLGRNDEAFAKIQQQLREITAESASKLYGANLHAKEKIGIGGNEGNKFWKDVDSNTNEGMKAYLQYYEDMVASHNLMKVDVDLNGLLNNEALDGMPNAKEYVKDYMRHAQGRAVGDVGNALNILVDAAPRFLMGIGPTATNAAIHQVAKRLGQNAMGHFNVPFTVMQYLQIPQTALPEAIGLAKNAGLKDMDFGRHLSNGAIDSLALTREKLSGVLDADPFRREMFDFAEANGLLNFSEFADVNKITQSTFGRKYDSVADFNRVHGEQATRPLVFFAFARLLKESGLPAHEVLGTAYNKTQYAMIDYTAPELPMMYSKMGVIGKTAGSLKTFTHGFLGQQMDWAARAVKGDWRPLATGVAMMALFSGMAGTPGYQELDQLYQFLTDKLGGKRQTIRETALANIPDMAKNGVLSDVTGINFQSRLGMADVLPNSIWDIPSPYTSTIGNMASSAYDLVKDPNEITARNAAKAWAPSSVRGPLEIAVGQGDKGRMKDGTSFQYTLDKEGRNDYPRTDKDWKLRYFGLTSMEESLTKDKLYNNTLTKMSDQDAQKQIVLEMKRGFRISKQYGISPEFKEQVEKYKARGGDPTTLPSIIEKDLTESKKSRKQRLEGIPSGSIRSIHDYDYYN